jgi:dethiobiotin synthetase
MTKAVKSTDTTVGLTTVTAHLHTELFTSGESGAFC